MDEAEAGLRIGGGGGPGGPELGSELHVHVAQVRDLEITVRRAVGIPVEQRRRIGRGRFRGRHPIQFPAGGAEGKGVARRAGLPRVGGVRVEENLAVGRVARKRAPKKLDRWGTGPGRDAIGVHRAESGRVVAATHRESVVDPPVRIGRHPDRQREARIEVHLRAGQTRRLTVDRPDVLCPHESDKGLVELQHRRTVTAPVERLQH